MSTETQTPAAPAPATVPAAPSLVSQVEAGVQSAVKAEVGKVELSLEAAISANPKKFLFVVLAFFIAGFIVGKLV